MLDKVQRFCRDALLRKLPHDVTDPHVTQREYMEMALTRYLSRNWDARGIYKEVLQDAIEHLEKGMPFTKSVKHKRVGENLFTRREKHQLADAKYHKRRVLREMELLGLLRPKSFGRYNFKEVDAFKILYDFICSIEEMTDERFKGFAAFIELDDDPDESVALLYENAFWDGKPHRTLIKKFYRNSKPYLLLKYLLLHEHKKKEFRVSEIYEALGVNKKDRKLSDWIKDLKIDEADRRGRYIKNDGEILQFSSHQLNGLSRYANEF